MSNPIFQDRYNDLISLHRALSDTENIDLLIHYCRVHAFIKDPAALYEINDKRKDRECLDYVGLHINRNEIFEISFTFGPQIQCITLAGAHILGTLLNGTLYSSIDIALLNSELFNEIFRFTPAQRRSQTAYYVLDRIKKWLY